MKFRLKFKMQPKKLAMGLAILVLVGLLGFSVYGAILFAGLNSRVDSLGADISSVKETIDRNPYVGEEGENDSIKYAVVSHGAQTLGVYDRYDDEIGDSVYVDTKVLVVRIKIENKADYSLTYEDYVVSAKTKDGLLIDQSYNVAPEDQKDADYLAIAPGGTATFNFYFETKDREVIGVYSAGIQKTMEF